MNFVMMMVTGVSDISVFHKDDFQYDFWNAYAWCVYQLYPLELMGIIKELSDRELMDPFVMDIGTVESALEEDREAFLENRRIQARLDAMDDIHGMMSWWACFDTKPSAPRISQAPVESAPKTKRKGKSANKKKKRKNKMKKASRKKNR